SRIGIKLVLQDKSDEKLLLDLTPYIKNLAKIDNLAIAYDYLPQKNEYVVVLKNMQVVMPLTGIVDVAGQLKKTKAKIDKLQAEIKNKKGMLANENFTRRAPKEIVEEERNKLNDLAAQLIKLEEIKNGLR
ncbi:hypothetical protein EPN54_02150, partial [bacterium]